MVGVIGGTGVLQGDQFTHAAEGRASESHQKIKQIGEMGSKAFKAGGDAAADAATDAAMTGGVAEAATATIGELAPLALL